VVCYRQLKLYANNPTEFGLETGYELRPLVRDDGLWGITKTVYLLDEQLSYALRCNSLVAQYSDCLFSQLVDKNKDLVVTSLVLRKVLEIYT
jgi:hypothetical protein